MTAHDAAATARGSAMTILSLAYMLAAGVGAAVAIREGLPGAFLGRTTGRTAREDFLLGAGTALSPGHSPHLQTKRDVVDHRQPRKHAVLLEDHGVPWSGPGWLGLEAHLARAVVEQASQ